MDTWSILVREKENSLTQEFALWIQDFRMIRFSTRTHAHTNTVQFTTNKRENKNSTQSKVKFSFGS